MRTASTSPAKYDAVIVGAGPNGLSAAIVLARAGLSTLVVEARETAGGGARTLPLTIPGFFHDVCSSVHPLAVASPFFRALGLESHGLAWQQSPAALAHVLDDGTAVTLERPIEATVEQFGRADGDRYRALFQPFVEHFHELVRMILAPLRFPEAPLLFARFGLEALHSMRSLAGTFDGERARGLLTGIAAHSMLPLGAAASASFALVLGSAGHAVGWPIARGGSQAITDALVACLRRHGGELEFNRPIEHLSQLPGARVYMLDVTPRQLLSIAGDQLSGPYQERLARFRYGPGVFKMDWALSAPIPWRDPSCGRASTVHLAGGFRDIARAEAAVHAGTVPERPFVLLVQPTLFDNSRAPGGRHTAWAYCHVPHGSQVDASAQIEAQIERHAPGFREVVLARSVKDAGAMERYNPNYVGGDINGGLSNLGQLFFRPVVRLDPYRTSAPNIYLCSSSTPPGGGVHGMCGYWAARSALKRVFGRNLSLASPTDLAKRDREYPSVKPVVTAHSSTSD
jgi:phytoene dehydrogenase-like protein